MGTITAEPAALPAVTLVELKTYLRIGSSEEDALLAGLVRSAGETCEAFTGQVLIARAVDELLPARSNWQRLSRAPVLSIEGADGLLADGTAQALASDAYAIDIDARGEGWVRLARPNGETRVRVHYRAGLAADWNGVPEPLRHGIVRLSAHLYSHRDDAAGRAPPTAVTALWRPWRRMVLR